MRTTVIIENLRCDDCKNTVATAIKKFKGISNFNIDITTGSLSFDYRSHNAMEGLRFYLSKIGFPITEDISLIKNRDADPDYYPFQDSL
ncbi:heavy-metal-associated domain-containing protein [Polaribacter sp. R77954]|uniref:heavy-metal-associated domain-containing protein n=1 Tax=Polaribacter sp. R77954 TaxID=3093870 RepID=UPI0037C91C82